MVPAEEVLLMKFILAFGEGNLVTEKTAQCCKTTSCHWLLLTLLQTLQLGTEGPDSTIQGTRLAISAIRSS